jgi:DNA-binding transcriptional LysR family regulator
MSAWDGIDEFVAVATAGTFTGGASAHGSSTTHMSRTIARLEARIQTQLFHRTTRSVKLTDTGRIFLDHCQRIILERDEAIALVAAKGEPQGKLRITCSTAMGEMFVAPIVRRYCDMHKKLSISLDLTNRVVDIISEGYDFAIRTGQVSDARLIGTQVASRSVYTCASPDYLARYGNPARMADLSHHQCLTGSGSIWHFHENGRDQVFRPKGRWQCNSGAAVVDAALGGLGICQLPEFYVLPHFASGALIPVLEEYRPSDEPIWAVYPQRRHLMPKISKLLELLEQDLPLAMHGTMHS